MLDPFLDTPFPDVPNSYHFAPRDDLIEEVMYRGISSTMRSPPGKSIPNWMPH
jgi:hypothetical protein